MLRSNHITSVRGMGGTAWRASTIALAAVLAMSLAAAGGAGTMASSDVETRIKAAFIYNFARFIEWPGRSGAGPVRIGILGHGELASPLEEVIRGKTANGRSIEVTHIGAATDMDCEILVIEHSESKHVAEIVQSLAGKPVLTVCDGGNCVRDGVMVVFQIVEESVRFQINQQAAEHAGLKISSQLLKVAIPAEGRHQ